MSASDEKAVAIPLTKDDPPAKKKPEEKSNNEDDEKKEKPKDVIPLDEVRR